MGARKWKSNINNTKACGQIADQQTAHKKLLMTKEEIWSAVVELIFPKALV